MKLRNIVWTAVAAVAAGLGAIVAAALGNIEMTVALGSAGVIAALLSNREV